MTERPLRTAVLVPARDEEESLPVVLTLLERHATGVSRAKLTDVVVVDNGSTDGTARVARQGGARVVEEPGPGYGRACQAGMAELMRRDPIPDVVVFLDADDPLAATQLHRLLTPLEEEGADLVLGRRVNVTEGEVPIHAAAGNWLVTTALRGMFGVAIRDMGPFRAARFAPLRALALDDPDFGWNVQMQVRALRAGLRVVEVPVHFQARTRGRSKVSGSFSGSLRAGARMLETLAAELVRHPPPPPPPPERSRRQSRTETKN